MKIEIYRCGIRKKRKRERGVEGEKERGGLRNKRERERCRGREGECVKRLLDCAEISGEPTHTHLLLR